MTHTIRLIRLKFIDTAEDEQTWSLNVRKQWEGTNKMALRVVAGTRVVGVTPPKPLQWYPYTGLSWETEHSSMATFAVDFGAESPNVLFEVIGLAKPPGTVLGIVFWSAESFIGSGSQYARQTLHVFRTGTGAGGYKKPRDASTVHAVIEVEIQAMTPPPTPRRLSAASASDAAAATAASNAGAASSSSPPEDTTTNNKTTSGATPSPASPSSPPSAQASSVSAYRKSMRLSLQPRGALSAAAIAAAASSDDAATAAAQLKASNAHLTTDMPLSYTFGMVRTSVLDLYFPNQLLSEGTAISPMAAPSSSSAFSSSSPAPASDAGGGGMSPTLSSASPSSSNFTTTTVRRMTASASGSIIVSNIICVANLSETANLSMQLIARGAGGADTAAALIFNPPGGVIVLPNQRAFFSVTWNSEKPLSSHLVEDVQLLLSGPDVSPAPVTFRVHFSDPKNNQLYAPYHYWANGTLVTNRPLNTHRELPFIRSVLPVFMVQQEMLNAMGNLLGSAGGYGHHLHHPSGSHHHAGGGGGGANSMGMGLAGSFNSGPHLGRQNSEFGFGSDYDFADDGLMVRDSDTGLHRRVVSSGAVGPALLPGGTRLSPHVSLSNTARGDAAEGNNNNNNQKGGGGCLAAQMKLLAVRSWRGEHARCTLRLGTLFGFPMMTSSSLREGTAPSFKVLAQLLNTHHTYSHGKEGSDTNDAAAAAGEEGAVAAGGNNSNTFGWAFEGGASEAETQEVYQTLSGSLRWNTDDKIVLLKRPNATLAQFLRLTLVECDPSDRGDETPIAAAIVSLPTDTASTLQPVPIFVAFYVFDTFSLFDSLPTSSLVMRGAAIKFSHVRGGGGGTAGSQ